MSRTKTKQPVKPKPDSKRVNWKKAIVTGLSTLFVATSVFAPFLSTPANAAPQNTTVDFAESMNQTQSKTITLPNTKRINGMTVDNGEVSFTQSGDQVTITVKNGTPSRTEFNPQKFSKSVTSSRTSDTNSFAATFPYTDGSGYTGTLPKSGSAFVISGVFTPYATKTVTQEIVQASNSGFPATKSYNDGEYSGTLNAQASVEQRVKSGSAPVSKTATNYRTSSSNSFAATMPYDDGTYSGTLNKSGSSYVQSGSYTAGSTYNQSGDISWAGCPAKSGETTISCSWYGLHRVASGEYYTKLATRYYGYGYPYWEAIDAANTADSRKLAIGQLVIIPEWSFDRRINTSLVNAGFHYKATYQRPATDTRVYRQNYSGTVWTDDTRVYEYAKDYTGTVSRPESDTRVWQQNYSGTAYKGGDDLYYTYKVEIDWDDTTPPSVPTGLKATPDDRKAVLSWTANPESQVVGYHVYKDGVKVTSTPVASPTFTATGLVNGQVYGFQISVVDDAGNESAKTTKVNVTPRDKVPSAAPSGLTSTPAESQITLKWAQNTEYDAKGYNVYMDGVKINTSLLTNTMTTFVVKNLVNYEDHKFEVTAIDTSDNESTKSAVTDHSIDLTPPAVPKGLAGTPGGNLATLNWTANTETDLDGYFIWQDGKKINSEPIKGTTFTIENLTNRTTYNYKISAVDVHGNESGQSANITVTPINLIPPKVPAGLTATITDLLGGDAKLTWGANIEKDLLGYNVYVDGNKVNSSPVSSALYNLNDLPYGKTYKVTISAVNDSLTESAQSAPVDIDLTPPVKPTGLKGAIGDHKVLVSWDKNPETDIKGYDLYKDGVKVNTTPITGTSYSVENLVNTQEYTFDIVAIDKNGNRSVKSDSIKAIPLNLTPPVVPTGLTAKVVDRLGGDIDLTWKANTEHDLLGYHVFVDGVKVTTTPITGNTFSVKDLAYGQNHTFAVSAINDSKTESNKSANVVVDLIPPVKPTGLKAEIGDHTVKLAWDKNPETDMKGYFVWVDGVKVNTTPIVEPAFTVENLNNTQEYSFAITAMDKDTNESVKSDSVKATPLNLVPAAVPSGLEAEVTDLLGGDVTLTWTPNTEHDLLGYHVFVDGVKVTSAPISEPTYSVDGLKYGENHNFAILALNDSLTESEKSALVEVDLTPPATPTGLAGKISDHTVDLSWAANTEEDMNGYFVWMDGKKLNSAPIKGTSFSVKDLVNTQEYQFELSAIDTYGNESPKSEPIKATPLNLTPPVVPTGVEAKVVDRLGGDVELSWTPNTEHDLLGYNVFMDGVKVNSAPLTEPKLAINDLEYGKDYFFTVSALNDSKTESKQSEKAEADFTAPAKTTGLKGEIGDHTVTLTWAANSEEDVDGYFIYVDGTKLNEEPVTGSTFTVGDLNNTQEYTFEVSAVDTHTNEGSKSDSIKATPLNLTPPVVPSEVAGEVDVIGRTVDLTWKANTEHDLLGYNVFVDGKKVNDEPVKDASYKVSGLVFGAEYSFQVSAINDSKTESEKSAPLVKLVRDWDAPAAPTGLQGEAGDHEAVLKWTANSEGDMKGYHIYQNGVRITTSPVEGTTFTVKGLSNGTQYLFSIAAVDTSTNVSGLSKTITVTPEGKADESVAVESPGTVPENTEQRYYDFSEAVADTIALNGSGTINSVVVTFTDGTQYVVNPTDTSLPSTITNIPNKPIDHVAVGYEKGTEPTLMDAKLTKDGELVETDSASAGTMPVKDTVAPNEITNLQANPITGNAVTFAWVNPTIKDFSGTLVFQDDVLVGKLTEGKINITGLTPNTSYDFVFRTQDTKGNMSEGVSKTITTTGEETPKLAGTVKPTATTTSTGETQISIPTVPGATNYTIKRDGVVIYNGPATSFVDKELQPGTEAEYEITATDDTGATTEPVTMTFDSPPGFPSNFIATPADGGIQLTWDNVAGADFYEVKIAGKSIGKVTGNKLLVGPESVIAGSLQRFTVEAGKNGSAALGQSSGLAVTTNSTKGLDWDKEKPAKPSTARAISKNDRITLTWGKVYNAQSYTILKNGVPVGQTFNTNFEVLGLTRDTQYQFEIYATNALGHSEKLALTASTLPYAPDAPVVTGETTTTSASVNWEPVQGAERYDLYINGSKYKTITGTSFTRESLNPDQKYTFEVYAWNDGGKSEDGEVALTTGASVPFETSRFYNISTTKTSTTLVWYTMKAADSYVVYDQDGNKVWEGTTTRATIENLTPGTNYTYTVKGVNSMGEGPGTSLEVMTVPEAPGVPAPTAEADPNAITISWPAVQHATSYEIHDVATGTRIWIGSATSYTVENLNPLTTYNYTVTAVNQSGRSEAVPVSATTTSTFATVMTITPELQTYKIKDTVYFTVTLKDKKGNPVTANTKITLSIIQPTGAKTTVYAYTNAAGEATAKYYVASTYKAGVYTIEGISNPRSTDVYAPGQGTGTFIVE